jgi:hypothetical protein
MQFPTGLVTERSIPPGVCCQSLSRSSLPTGESFEAEVRLRRTDGEYHWMLHRKVPARDDQGSIVMWYGSGVNIEDRRRAEEDLQQARSVLAHVIRALAMGELVASIARLWAEPGSYGAIIQFIVPSVEVTSS